ncbi:MAG: shikimate kinase [Planctomycetaceae bacterium]
MIVTLIGYRGSGKSTLAPELSRRLGCPALDADVLLEQRAGMTIREIFDREGEPGFRRRETALLADLLTGPPCVLAAGGGAVLNAETRTRMRAAGPVVWLQAPVQTLAQRIAGDPSTAGRRPNLAGGGEAEIVQLLAAREPLYRECATLALSVEGQSVTELADQVCRHLNLPGSPD